MGFEVGNKLGLGNKHNVGKIPWNKGMKVDRIKYPNMGAFGKRSEDQKKKISDGHKGQKSWNKGNGEWTGDDNEYRLLHKWVERRLGKPMCCDFCNELGLKSYHWANKSGKYRKEVNDWIRLCQKCHTKYDKERRVN